MAVQSARLQNLNTIIDQNEPKNAKIALQMLVLKSRKKPKLISQAKKY